MSRNTNVTLKFNGNNKSYATNGYSWQNIFKGLVNNNDNGKHPIF